MVLGVGAGGRDFVTCWCRVVLRTVAGVVVSVSRRWVNETSKAEVYIKSTDFIFITKMRLLLCFLQNCVSDASFAVFLSHLIKPFPILKNKNLYQFTR